VKRKSKHAIAYIDGSSIGNPGPAGIGVLIFIADNEDLLRSNPKIIRISEPIGFATNNQAEYKALIKALEEAKTRGIEHITIYSDSQLLVKQVNGLYKVKSKSIGGLHAHAIKLLSQFASAKVEYIGREANREADKLAKDGAKRVKI